MELTEQLTLPGIGLTPTPAMVKGHAYLTVCSQCGALLYVPSGTAAAVTPRSALDPCPVCSHPASKWRPVRWDKARHGHIEGPFWSDPA